MYLKRDIVARGLLLEIRFFIDILQNIFPGRQISSITITRVN